MKSFIVLFVLCFGTGLLFAQSSVVAHDDDYYKKKVRNTELIYTKKYQNIAQDVADLQMVLQGAYERSFGYKLDEILYSVIASQYNQITNGFTDFSPNARQVDYIGGALMSDYFCTASWIDTLIYHETAHTYQLNAKDNVVSSSLHSVIKNGTIIFPFFTSPNIVENPFILEGNAVLNESWHNNGGRLYGGNFKAQTLLAAKYHKLTPELLYNNNLNFLFGDYFYTYGSYYQYFLAKKYGLKTTNSYFRLHSKYWFWPFSTNHITKRVFGKSFETLIWEWNNSMSDDAQNIKEAKGKILATSEYFVPLNGDKDEIYFVINKTAREYPQRVVYDKKTKTVSMKVGSYKLGKMLKTKDAQYVTQSSGKTNPWRIYIGLYDSDAIRVDNTASKVVEGYLANGDMVYFDVPSSYHNPQLYIGDKFYESVNSSVFIDGNDIYYAKQNGKVKTFYKNRQKLFSIDGFYGHIVGVDADGVYFIANTKLGSGLFKYSHNKFYLMNNSDTITDARIIDKKSAVVVSVGVDAYKYMEVALGYTEQKPYDVKLFMEDKSYYGIASEVSSKKVKNVPKTDLNEKYYSLLDMIYKGVSVNVGSDDDAGFLFNISVDFADPIMQNQLGLFLLRNADEFVLGGATYLNEEYFINYRVSAYGVIDRPDEPTEVYSPNDKRDYGVVADAKIDLLEYGYNYGYITGSYFEDYSSNSRKPLSASVVVGNAKHFGISMYENFKFQLQGYGGNDRGDGMCGAKAVYKQGLKSEFYFLLNAQYSKSDADTPKDERGIKLAKNLIEQFEDSDPSSVLMYSLKNDSYYAKEITKYGAKAAKVFNYNFYFFTFPLSLRRESVYLAYNHYDLEEFDNTKTRLNQATMGITFDTTILNSFAVPFTFEYNYNDKDTIANRHTFSFGAGYSF